MASPVSFLNYVWSSYSKVIIAGTVPAPIVYLPDGPYPAGSTFPVYGQLVDIYGNGIPADQISTLTLTIIDTQTGLVINDVLGQDILNTDRGTVDDKGNLVIMNEAGDTSMAEVPGAASVQRSYILNWAYTAQSSSAIGGFVIGTSPIGGDSVMMVGAQQVNFTLVAIGAPAGVGGFIIGVSGIGVGAIG